MNLDSPIEKIHSSAELAIMMANEDLGMPVGFDRAGVEWLDGFIQRRHDERRDKDFYKRLTQTLGSYFGECIIREYGGSWQLVNGSWGVIFDNSNGVFPFAKVEKHLRYGADDSVLSLYNSIAVLFRLEN